MPLPGTKTDPAMTAVHTPEPADSTPWVPPTAAGSSPLPAPETQSAANYARAEKAEGTRRAYRSDFEIFRAWCRGRSVGALPTTPEAVATFLAHEADRKIRPSTIGRRLAAIRYAHKLAGLPLPTDDERVRATMRGIRRVVGLSSIKKGAATADRVISMAPAPDECLANLRDRALLLVGFAGAFRRSELMALNCEDIDEVAEGLRITIRRSKTDQESKGAQIGIPRGTVACPVAAMRAWLDAACIVSGPVFRPIAKGGHVQNTRLSDRSIADIVKRRAAEAGLDARQFSAHSLRSGFLTSAAGRGASIFRMADQSRHRSLDTVRHYVRNAELFRDHPGAGLL